MSLRGWVRRIGHWFFGGRNASHIKALPFNQINDEEFRRVSAYLEKKHLELLQKSLASKDDAKIMYELQSRSVKKICGEFQNFWTAFKDIKFANFPELYAEWDGLKTQYEKLEKEGRLTDELEAKYKTSDDTVKYKVQTIESRLKVLGRNIGAFNKLICQQNLNYELIDELRCNIAPLVHGITDEVHIDRDESSYLEVF